MAVRLENMAEATDGHLASILKQEIRGWGEDDQDDEAHRDFVQLCHLSN
jgi:hypothetical protein